MTNLEISQSSQVCVRVQYHSALAFLFLYLSMDYRNLDIFCIRLDNARFFCFHLPGIRRPSATGDLFIQDDRYLQF